MQLISVGIYNREDSEEYIFVQMGLHVLTLS